MVNDQLINYIKQQIASGVDKDTIRRNLLTSGGWQASDIDEAFATIEAPSTGVPLSPNIPSAPVKYAGFWIRWVAVMVDGLIVGIPVGIAQIVIAFVVIKSGGTETAAKIVNFLFNLLTTWSYFSLMTYYKNATLGKMLVGITVKSDDFQKLSIGKVILRETVGKFVSGIILGIGYFMAGVTAKKQALHDKMAHSVVVYKDPSKPRTAGLIIAIIVAAILPIIAIIGLLASVVLASLNHARQLGKDAKTKSDLSTIRMYAEIYREENMNSYSKAKDCFSGMFASKDILSILSNSLNKNITCYAEGGTYAVSAELAAPSKDDDKNFCVDSAGYMGNSIATSDGKVAKCQKLGSVGEKQNSSASESAESSVSEYSYALPGGWEKVPKNEEGIEALNEKSGSGLIVSVGSMPQGSQKDTAIDTLVSKKDMEKIVKVEFPGATISVESTGIGMLGAAKALTIDFKKSGGGTEAGPLYVLQYSAFYNGHSYTLIFLTPYGQKDSARADFKEIINSFRFK